MLKLTLNFVLTGEYPKGSCQEKCEKCPQNPASATDKVKCFCNNQLCSNEDCSNCEKRKSCKPGHQLNRSGKAFVFI